MDTRQHVIVDILVNEKPIREFGLDGKTFIQSNEGTEYSIRIKNNNAYRVLAIVSVDSLNIIDGKPADKDGQGYIVNAYSSIVLRGYRKDLNTVGAFKFSKKSEGYAATKGKEQNSGVIGVCLYAEDIKYAGNYNKWEIKNIPNIEKPILYWPTIRYQYNYKSSPIVEPCSDLKSRSSSESNILRSCNLIQSNVSESSFDTSTTWGTKLNDSVKFVDFDKGAYLGIFCIYYASAQSLTDLGIVLQPVKQAYLPPAFKEQEFAKPPKYWEKF